MYSPSLKRTESESPIRVVFAAELSPKRTRGSRPASKPSACPAPLQPTGAPSVQTQPQQPHPFQAVQCQGLAKTCSHQRHQLVKRSVEPASSEYRSSLVWGNCSKHSPLQQNLARGGTKLHRRLQSVVTTIESKMHITKAASLVAVVEALVLGTWIANTSWRSRKQIWQIQSALIGGSVGFVAGRLTSKKDYPQATAAASNR